MNGGATEGGARGGRVKRWLEATAEVWRERRSERRARAEARVVTPRLPRSTLAAAADARLAVRAGVRLDDFLRHRLARYAGKLPVPLEGLPVSVEVEGGDVVVRGRARPRSYGPRPQGAAPAGGEPAGNGSWDSRELRDATAALDRGDLRTAEARARLDVVERELAAALASGAVVPRPVLEATPEQLGRPPVPSAAPIHALRAFVGALLVAEAWRFSAPVLATAGVPGDVEAALRAAPAASGLALLFALGAAAAAFTFAWLALARGADALSAGTPAGRRPLLLAAATGAAALVPGVAAAAADPARWAQLALLAAVPFAAAALVRAASALAARRAAAAEVALEWDRERAREAVERARQEERCLRAAEELRAAEAEQLVARRRVARLHRAGLAAQRAAELASRAETERLERLSEGLACALELDRYLFVRFAAERNHAPVERPARARVVEPSVGTGPLGVAG